MPNWKRAFVPGGSYFFTVVTHKRAPLFRNSLARELLGSVFRRCLIRYPFRLDAIVLLPEHLNAIWTLPPGDSEYPKRWGWIKKEFTKSWLNLGGHEGKQSDGRKRERRRGVWQRKYWEHTLEDAEDYEQHFDYIHNNPVKHGYVRCPVDWQWSSFHRWVRSGVYDKRWACWQSDQQVDFTKIAKKSRRIASSLVGLAPPDKCEEVDIAEDSRRHQTVNVVRQSV